MAGQNAIMFGLEPLTCGHVVKSFKLRKGTLKLPTLKKKITKSDKSTTLSPEAHDRFRESQANLPGHRCALLDFRNRLFGEKSSRLGAGYKGSALGVGLATACPAFPSEILLKGRCDPREVTLFVDAFWSLESTSGALSVG